MIAGWNSEMTCKKESTKGFKYKGTTPSEVKQLEPMFFLCKVVELLCGLWFCVCGLDDVVRFGRR